jgi:hypothetical protein
MKNPQRSQWGGNLTCRRTKLRITSDLSETIKAKTECSEIFSVESKKQSRILYLMKLSSKNEEKIDFADKQKIREFLSSK